MGNLIKDMDRGNMVHIIIEKREEKDKKEKKLLTESKINIPQIGWVEVIKTSILLGSFICFQLLLF